MSEFFTYTVNSNNYSAIFGGWTADPSPSNRGVWYNYVHQNLIDYVSDNFDGGSAADGIAFALPGYKLILYDNDGTTVRATSNAINSNTIVRSSTTSGVDKARLTIT
jgi:hypothetical protein